MSNQTITVTWVDPPVNNGQVALATVSVFSSLFAAGVYGPLVPFGTVTPGTQTLAVSTAGLALGSSYRFAVQVTDANGQLGPIGYSAVIGPIGAPGVPTVVHAVLA